MDKIRERLEAARELLEKADPSLGTSGVSPTTVNTGAAAAIMASGGFRKDDLDEKIKAKMKAEMGKRNFSEADATRHVIDRDRGQVKTSKPSNQLLQSEHEVSKEEDFRTEPPPVTKADKMSFSKNGQWSLAKDNSVKPFGQSVYNSAANMKRKATRTGEVREDAGRNSAVRQYTTSGSSMQDAHNAAEAKERKKNPAPVKTYSKEEIAEMNAKLKNNQVKKGGLGQADENTYKEEVSENKDKFGSGED